MSDVNGNLAEGPYVYDAYGNCFSAGAACSAGVGFRYTGQRLDPETGLYYYRARYYQPGIGQFLQTDPVGYKDNLNLYGYVGDDPTDKTDPTGKIRWGFDATVKLAFIEGGRVTIEANYDTQSKEVGVSVVGGGGYGAQFGAKAEVYTEPSSVKGNEFKISGPTVKAEGAVQAHLGAGKMGGKIGAEGSVSLGGSYSTRDGATAPHVSVEGSIGTHKGAGSADSNGRISIAHGGAEVGVAVRGELGLSGNVSLDSVRNMISNLFSSQPSGPPSQQEMRSGP
jgi:RHS repeat-associated protein